MATYRSLSDTQEESASHEAAIVLNEGCASRHYSPDQHPRTHVYAGLNSSDQHVRGDLHQNVTNEETAHLSALPLYSHPPELTSDFNLEAFSDALLGSKISYMETVVLNCVPDMFRSSSRLLSRA